VCINVAYIGAYATDVLATQQMYYHQHLPWSYQILLILGTQIFGFSLGGILRQFVVWPASMIWPSTLVNSALFNTLHKNYGKRDRGHMTREKFFFIVCACSFVWYWVPGYLFTALSVFNWGMCLTDHISLFANYNVQFAGSRPQTRRLTSSSGPSLVLV
jgi:hypothetical protein